MRQIAAATPLAVALLGGGAAAIAGRNSQVAVQDARLRAGVGAGQRVPTTTTTAAATPPPPTALTVEGVAGSVAEASVADVGSLDALRLATGGGPSLGESTRACLAKGHCRIEEKVICDIGLVAEICQNRNALFTGSASCDCQCDPTKKMACPVSEGRHEWHEDDCSCVCVENGDALCAMAPPPLGHPAKRMTAYPDCGCRCDTKAAAECGARPGAAERWSWKENDCTCECNLDAKQCAAGQTFFEDRCACSCKDEDRDACAADTSGKLEWDESSCLCRCQDSDGARATCVQKRAADSAACGAALAAPLKTLGYTWTGAPACQCDCTATDAACKSAAPAGAEWVASGANGGGGTCRCRCSESAAATCLSKKDASGAYSQLRWDPFPACACVCPPTAQATCDASRDKALQAYTAEGRKKPAAKFAAAMQFDSAGCACRCDQTKKAACATLVEGKGPDKGVSALLRGEWTWSGRGSCTCSCSLDAAGATGKDQCTLRDSRLVFDSGAGDESCRCKCGPDHDEAACKSRATKQATALKAMPHLARSVQVLKFAPDTCSCKCKVTPQACAAHNAILDRDACACVCPVGAKERCVKANPKNVWSDVGCSCKCALTPADCPEGRQLVTADGACECRCADGPDSEKKVCELKQRIPGTGENIDFDPVTCSCGCAASATKATCTCADPDKNFEKCEIFDPTSCGCVSLKDAICPTNVHLGCKWLFRQLEAGRPKLEASFGAGAADAARYPSLAVCNTVIESSMSSEGLRKGIPSWVEDAFKTKLGSLSDSVARNIGTHCRAACEMRFSLLATARSNNMGACKTSAKASVSMNAESCHVFSRKDIFKTDAPPSAFKTSFEQAFSGKDKDKRVAVWVKKVQDRTERQLSAPCSSTGCDSAKVPSKIFYEAMSMGWPVVAEARAKKRVARL